MSHIVIISSSVRIKRNSHRVALYFKKYIEDHQLATVEILDLNAYQFPIFNERLRLQVNPSAQTLEFAQKITSANGVIIVTPEYNGGYPAALKNVVDLLHNEWRRKPIAISTVSAGSFGGSQVITSLQFTLWKIQAWTVPAMFPVPNIQDAFDENGSPTDKVATDKRAESFIKELMWCIEANEKMNASV
jgi:NAD(P)H-dependent FMN reductase